MAATLLSLARNRPVRKTAMTGELMLIWQVLSIGGIRELILQEDNQEEFEEVPEHIRKGIKVPFAATFEDVVPNLFGC